MWAKLKRFVLRLAGYVPCFSCGTVGFHGWGRKQTRSRWLYSTQEGHRSVRYKASLDTEGLCQKCFDPRAEAWLTHTSQAFDDLFEERKELCRK